MTTTASKVLRVGLVVVAVAFLAPTDPFLAAVGLGGEVRFELPVADKLVHLVAFAALGILAVRVRRGAGARRPGDGAGRTLGAVVVGLTFYGAALELAQGVLPWRSAEAWDLLADVVGAAVGSILALADGTRFGTRASGQS